MHVGIDIRHLASSEPTGIGLYTLALLSEWQEKTASQRITLFSSGSSRAKRLVQKHLAPYSQYAWEHRHLPNRLVSAAMLGNLFPYETFTRTFPDVWFFPNLHFFPRVKSPYVLTFHDLAYEMFSDLLPARERRWHTLVRPKHLAEHAHTLIAPSLATKFDIASLYEVPSDRIAHIPHGVDGIFTPRPSPQDAGVRSRYRLPRHYILAVGDTRGRKNTAALVEAFHHLRKQSPVARRLNLDLVLVGPGQPLSYVPREHLPALYRGAEMFVSPSLYEGFSLPILEAMASGTPVAASHTSAHFEVGQDAVAYIDPYRSAEIARVLREILEDEALNKELRERGKIRAQEFSWKKTAEKTWEVLTKAVS